MNQLNEEQAEQAASLVHTIRPDWAEADIYRLLEPQLGCCKATDLLIALLLAADNPQQTIPAIYTAAGCHPYNDPDLQLLNQLLENERQAG